MAQITETRRRGRPATTKGRRSFGVDLTPMVDLGFLLMTFFILTTALREPKVANLELPIDKGDTQELKNSAVITLMLLGNDSINYYHGKNDQEIYHTTFAGIRKVIQEKQKFVAQKLGDRRHTILIVKPTDKSRYQNLIDILDEIAINGVTRYYILNK